MSTTMTRHNLLFEDPWWVAAGMIAQAQCSTHSEVVRAALRHYARCHGLNVVEGEVVRMDPSFWARESTPEETIQGGGESTGEGPGDTPGGGPATRSRAEDPTTTG